MGKGDPKATRQSGEWANVTATATSDRICAVQQTCDEESTYEPEPGSQVHDRTCSQLTLYMDEEYEPQPETSTSDRVCAAPTACDACDVNVPERSNKKLTDDNDRDNDQETENAGKGCGTGKYLDQTTQATESACKDCDTGKYLDQTAQDAESDCKSCDKGTYRPRKKLRGNDDCHDGTCDGKCEDDDCDCAHRSTGTINMTIIRTQNRRRQRDRMHHHAIFLEYSSRSRKPTIPNPLGTERIEGIFKRIPPRPPSPRPIVQPQRLARSHTNYDRNRTGSGTARNMDGTGWTGKQTGTDSTGMILTKPDT